MGREIYEQREFSEHTAQVIDEEVSRILHEAADHALRLLGEHRDKLDAIAQALEKNEVLDDTEVEELVGPSAYRSRAETNGQAHDESEKPKETEPAAKA